MIEFALYFGTELVHEQSSFTLCLRMTKKFEPVIYNTSDWTLALFIEFACLATWTGLDRYFNN